MKIYIYIHLQILMNLSVRSSYELHELSHQIGNQPQKVSISCLLMKYFLKIALYYT